MSEIQAELVSELEIPFFTYFKDQFGIIYYSHGYDIGGCIAATCVYVPSRSQTDRIELASGSYYTKYIDHGDGVNINHPLTQIDMHYSGLLASMQNTSYGNIPCLLVPRDTVVHVYDPHDFNSFCEKIPALDATIKNTVAQFAAIGVPLSDMGLCGALQVGIFNQADGTYKDVDLIVSGTEHYPAISSFSVRQHQSLKGVMEDLQSKVDATLSHRVDWLEFQSALHSRNRKMAIPIENGTRILDIKIRRRRQIKVYNLLQQPTERICITGTVVSDENHTLPGICEIETSEGEKWWVTNFLYHLLGGCWCGDKVTIQGRLVESGHILVAEHLRDSILRN